jgi:hypothetical protein
MSEEEDKRTRLVDQVEEEYAALVAYELSAAKWEQLEAVEAGDELHFPDVLHVRRKTGEFEPVPVMFAVPLQPTMRKARVLAKQLAARDKIDQEADKNLFDDLENACILWYAIRSATPPFEPYAYDVDALEKKFGRDVLKLAWQKLEGYRRVVDPRPASITKEQCLAVVGSIAGRRAISPLLVFDGPAQTACIVFMASLLQSFLTQLSSPPSSESSTPGPST